jgi:hypothetical protein
MHVVTSVSRSKCVRLDAFHTDRIRASKHGFSACAQFAKNPGSCFMYSTFSGDRMPFRFEFRAVGDVVFVKVFVPKLVEKKKPLATQRTLRYTGFRTSVSI